MEFILKRPTKVLSLFYMGALLMVLGSIQYFLFKIAGILNDKPIGKNLWFQILLKIHIVGGLIAIFSGPTQLFDYFRIKNLKLHKRLGYTYAFSVLTSGLIGFFISFFAMGGFISKSGLITLSTFWLGSLFLSMKNIYSKNIERHKFWMFINYALTFGAVTQRLILGIGQLIGFEFLSLYSFTNWVSWMLNICFVLWKYNRRAKN
ncbi:MAG: hypothetical protein RLZZ546_3104 [Bacteroidota bacterium]|jgi:uncharacterized membrane protein